MCRCAAPFDRYKDADWRFADVWVEEPGAKGEDIDYGWRCPRDAGHSPGYVWRLMRDRQPGGDHGIETLAVARARGCTFAPFPETRDS